jgi:hypothetical protein
MAVALPDTQGSPVACKGFNRKNHYDRETPCDQDFLRKLGKQTEAAALMRWFGADVARIWRTQRSFDKEGIFIGDASYLFVPDNENYEGSVRMLFDGDDHPVSQEDVEKMSDQRKLRCQWRRCYKMVTLLHTTSRLDFFLFVSVKIVPGNAGECPLLYQMVEEFVQEVGTGIIKWLILDRGFLDGAKISRCKLVHKIDVLIPARKNMEIYDDAMRLFDLPDVAWFECKDRVEKIVAPQRPGLKPIAIRRREAKRQKTLKDRKEELPPPPPDRTIIKKDAAAINEFTCWSSCSVPLTVIANREHYADGHIQTWLLLSTKPLHYPTEASQLYHLRTATEERYRQLKCFTDLAGFTSRAFSLIVNQVVFTMLAYNLLQIYLLRKGPGEFTAKTPLSVRRQLLPSANHIIVYKDSYYGLFTPLELIELMTVGISEEARKKIGEKCRRLRRELPTLMSNPRPT